MALDDALIAKFLALEAQGANVVNAPAAPSYLTMGLRDAYAAVEAEMRECLVTVKARSDRYPRGLLLRPGQGLFVTQGIDATPWAELPDAILAQHRPLLADLRAEQVRLAPRQQAQVLQQLAQADIDEATGG